MQKVTIRVWFEEQTKFGRYTDSLYFTPEDYEEITEEHLNTLKKERVDRWVENREKRKALVYEPTEEDLAAERDELELQKTELESRIAELTIRLEATVGK